MSGREAAVEGLGGEFEDAGGYERVEWGGCWGEGVSGGVEFGVAKGYGDIDECL